MLGSWGEWKTERWESENQCNSIAYPIARWYSRLPKFVCGTIKPMLYCCVSFFVSAFVDSSFFAWCCCLCRSLSPPPIRFGPRSPIEIPVDSDDDFDRNAKVVDAIIDMNPKTNNMYDVFIVSHWLAHSLPQTYTHTPFFNQFSSLCEAFLLLLLLVVCCCVTQTTKMQTKEIFYLLKFFLSLQDILLIFQISIFVQLINFCLKSVHLKIGKKFETFFW